MTVRPVSNASELTVALAASVGGDVIEMAAGNYGNVNITGTYSSFVTIIAADLGNPPVLTGMDLVGDNIILDRIRWEYTNSTGIQDTYQSFESPNDIDNSSFITVRNCTFVGDRPTFMSGFGSGGGLAVRNSNNILIERNDFYYWMKALSLYGVTQGTVRGNDIHDNNNDAIVFTDAIDLLIENNYLHDHVAGGRRPVAGFPTGDNGHNDFIQAFNGLGFTRLQNITIRGNFMDAGVLRAIDDIFMMNEAISRHGGSFADYAYWNIVIEDNILYNGHGNGIAIGYTDGLTIRNNTLIRDPHVTSGPVGWYPEIRSIEGPHLNTQSINLIVEDNVCGASSDEQAPGTNFDIQDTAPASANYYEDVFVNPFVVSPDLDDLRATPGGDIITLGVGAARTRSAIPLVVGPIEATSTPGVGAQVLGGLSEVRRTLRTPEFGAGPATAGGMERVHSAVSAGIFSFWHYYPSGLNENDTIWATATGSEQLWVDASERMVMRWGGVDNRSSIGSVLFDTWQQFFIRFGNNFDGSGNDIQILIDNASDALAAGGATLEIDDVSILHNLMQDDGADTDYPGEVHDFIFDAVDPATVGPTDYNYSAADGGKWVDISQALHATLSYRIAGQTSGDATRDGGPAGNHFTQSVGGGDTYLSVANLPPGANPSTLLFSQAGSGAEVFAGAGTQAMPSLAQGGSGAHTSITTGIGDQALPLLTQLSSAVEMAIAAGAQAVVPLTQAGDGIHTPIAPGAGAQELEPLVQDAVGVEEFIADGAQALETPVQAGIGVAEIESAGVQVLDPLAQTASSVHFEQFLATGAMAIPLLAQSGDGVAEIEGAGIGLLEMLAQAAAGAISAEPSKQTLPLLVQAGDGTHFEVRTGAGVMAIPLLAQSGDSIVQLSGAGISLLERLAQTAAGVLKVPGSSAQSLGVLFSTQGFGLGDVIEAPPPAPTGPPNLVGAPTWAKPGLVDGTPDTPKGLVGA